MLLRELTIFISEVVRDNSASLIACIRCTTRRSCLTQLVPRVLSQEIVWEIRHERFILLDWVEISAFADRTTVIEVYAELIFLSLEEQARLFTKSPLMAIFCEIHDRASHLYNTFDFNYYSLFLR